MTADQPARSSPEVIHPFGEQHDANWQQVDEACQLAGQVLEHAYKPDRAIWMRRLLAEHPRFTRALDWLYQQGQAERGLELTLLLEELWFEDEHTREGRAWFERFLALPGAQTQTSLAQRAQALDLAGALALIQEDYRAARRLQEQGLSIGRELEDPIQTGFALIHLGHLVGFVGSALASGTSTTASQPTSEDFAAAQTLYQEAIDLLKAANHAGGVAHACANLASLAILQGQYAAAAGQVSESLQRYRALDDPYNLAQSVWRAAGVAAGMGQPAQALRLAGAGAAHMAAVGVVQPPVYQRCYDAMLVPARRELDPATQAALWAEGQAWGLEQAVEAALAVLAG